MKSFVSVLVMALVGIGLVSTPAFQALGQTIQIRDPAEFNAYQNFITQTAPAQKCAGGESFLQTYPQSVVKKTVLDQMIDCYQQLNQSDNALSAASRSLQADPNGMKAIYISVWIKKNQCAKSVDASGYATDLQTCDYAGALAQEGLTVPKPAEMTDVDWRNLTTAAYPVFHSVIAFDDLVSKKDFKGAIAEYTSELMLYPPDATTKPGPGLADTLQLAEAYSKPGPTHDETKACWFYARAWDYAPANFKPQIELKLDYWYKHYHGTFDGDVAITQQVNDIKQQAQASLFPSVNLSIAPGPSSQQLAEMNYDNQLASAMSLVKANRLAEARSAAAALVQSTPDRWEGYGLEGTIDEMENKPNEAKAAYQHALNLAPTDVRPQLQERLRNIELGTKN